MNILAVGAHADDVELGCGGTLAKRKEAGDNIIIYTATASGGTNPYGNAIRDKKESLEDGERAARLLGAKLIIGSFETNMVEFSDDLNMELIRVITDNQIDIMYTHWVGDVHHDHRSLARASIHAGRHLNNILMYRSNWFQSEDNFHANFYEDITEYWDVKEKLLSCYKVEMDRSEGKWVRYNRNRAENYGMIVGTEYAEAFEVVKWLNW